MESPASAIWRQFMASTSEPSRADVPDAHLDLQPKARKGTCTRLRHSALASASPARKLVDEAGAERSPLRQSALAADSAQAQNITTMENADIDAMIVGIAAVIRAYTRDAARTKRASDLTKPEQVGESASFDEEAHPLDESGMWRHVPKAASVEDFVRRVVVALELDESSVVIGLILLERAVATNPAAPLLLSSRTWRPALLMAIVVASKVVYDEKVFLADYREQLPRYCLKHAPQQELAFLTLLGYNTTVRRGEYARYYYALEDVARIEWERSAAEGTSMASRAQSASEWRSKSPSKI